MMRMATSVGPWVGLLISVSRTMQTAMWVGLLGSVSQGLRMREELASRILASFCLTTLAVTLHLLTRSTHPGVQPFLDDDAL